MDMASKGKGGQRRLGGRGTHGGGATAVAT
jgi:hypothetical protein